MKITIKVTEEDGKLYVTSPYNRDYVKAARTAGGKWEAAREAWRFDADMEARVMDLLRDTYGYEGEEGEETRVTVEFEDIYNPLKSERDAAMLFGVPVVRRYDRDSPVWLADGVAVLKGAFLSSGGSRNRPSIEYPEDPVTLRVFATPGQMAWLDAHKIPYKVDGGELDALKARRERLRQELEALDRRIAELQD